MHQSGGQQGGAARPRDESAERSDDVSRAAERRRSTTRPRRAIDCQVAAVLESVTHGFLALDATWRVTYANAAALRLSGRRTLDEIVGRSHWVVWPEAVGTEVERRYRAVVADGQSAHFEHHYAARDVWHEIHAFPTDEGGLAVVYRDVTGEHAAAAERDRCAAALAVRERELAMILETASDGVVRFDRALRVTFANSAVERATGIPRAQLLGRTPRELGLAPELVGRSETRLRALLDGRYDAEAPPDTFTFELESPLGVRWYEARGVVEPAADGQPVAVLVVSRDITARVTAEQQLAHALGAAEAANRAKAEFLATMSHELRTPLNAIRGFTELLEIEVHGPVTDAQRECLGRIKRSEQHLLGLIGEILEHARLEAGRVEYATTTVRAGGVIDEVVAWMRPHAERAGLALDGRTCDAWVRGDPQRVRQIVVNLLSNALKFTPRGGRVLVRCQEGTIGRAAGGGGAVRAAPACIEVRDTGPGIPLAERERVFQPFVQLGRSRRNPVAGIGLGLSISREFARGMGGDLVVDDAPEGGACFRLTLPAAPVIAGGAEGARLDVP